MIRKFALFLILVFMAILIFNCANQLAPGGGEEDRTPPSILFTYPKDSSTNFNDNKLIFRFSEYVDKRSFQESIFISPYLEEESEYDWSGREVEVKLNSKLKENQTYVVTIGTDVFDLRRNKMNSSYSLKFSTGNKLDNGTISGKVFDKNPFGLMVFLYKINDTSEVNFSRSKPDYLTQVSKDGTFNFYGLSNGLYKLIAVKDEFRNLLYEVEQDKIGFPSSDILLTDSTNAITDIFIEMTKEDSSKPQLISITSKDRNHIILNFNEAIDSSSCSENNFIITEDSTEKIIKVLDLFRGQLSSTSLNVLVERLNPEKEYNLTATGIKDMNGNSLDTVFFKFTSNSLLDTIPPKLIEHVPNQLNPIVDYKNPDIFFKFNDVIKFDSLVGAIALTDSMKNKVKNKIKKVDGSSFYLSIDEYLLPKMIYELKFNLKYASDINGNKIDSILTLNFKTTDDSYYSSISGKVITNYHTNKNNFIVEAKGLSKQKNYSQKVDSTLSFKFESLQQGNYLIKLYKDLNQDGKYSFGSSIQKTYSEPFKYFSDTVKVKPRWPITDIIITW